MKTLIIAEKPSVAGDLAKALGKVPKKDDHYENDELIISSAVGHLVELFMPEDIDPKLKRWSMLTLPIIPEKFALKPIEKAQKKFQDLKRLLSRSDVGSVINACDAGREGELIFTYLYELAKCKKPVKRLWMMSMTGDSIREAYSKLRTQEDMQPLQEAARCRSESDWLIGINGTRAITARLYAGRIGNVATVGRVQTPTLALVVEREKAIGRFIPRTFWRILGHFDIHEGEYTGTLQKPGWKKSNDEHDRIDRFWELKDVEALLENLNGTVKAQVTEEKKRTRQAAPRLYDLTTLQREANSRYGFPASRTLQCAQALYEKHKVLTYPRTDSRALPEDYLQTCQDTLRVLQGDLGEHAGKVIAEGWVKPDKRIFNNKEISDHFAIIPTTETPKNLTVEEEKIYDMVARRFVSVFYPSAEFDVTTRISTVKDAAFKTEGKVLAEPGWMAVYGKDAAGEATLPALSKPDGTPPEATVKQIEKDEDTTKPPARYTEATLLAAMEGAGKLVEDEEMALAMKEKGLGTPATRAQVIDHLIREKYIDRIQRDLHPTTTAENLIDGLAALKIEALTSPAMTGEWEFKLSEIQAGRFTRETFMSEIAAQTRSLVEKAKAFNEEEAGSTPTDVISPTDNQPLIETLRAYRSQDGKLVIYKTMGNRKLEIDEVRELFLKGSIGPIDGFRSKMGKPFSAMLKFDAEECKVKFVFENSGGTEGADDGVDLTTFPALGSCPICKEGIVREAPSSYTCERYKREGGCKFKISRMILGKAIPSDQFLKLMTVQKTDLLEGFRSNRTKRLFSAHLILKEDGAIGFEFAARTPKATKKTTKKATKRKTKDESIAEAESTN